MTPETSEAPRPKPLQCGVRTEMLNETVVCGRTVAETVVIEVEGQGTFKFDVCSMHYYQIMGMRPTDMLNKIADGIFVGVWE